MFTKYLPEFFCVCVINSRVIQMERGYFKVLFTQNIIYTNIYSLGTPSYCWVKKALVTIMSDYCWAYLSWFLKSYKINNTSKQWNWNSTKNGMAYFLKSLHHINYKLFQASWNPYHKIRNFNGNSAGFRRQWIIWTIIVFQHLSPVKIIT